MVSRRSDQLPNAAVGEEGRSRSLVAREVRRFYGNPTRCTILESTNGFFRFMF
jgi:hypothetical protein